MKVFLWSIVFFFSVPFIINADILTRKDIPKSSLSNFLTYSFATFNKHNELKGYKGISIGYLGYHSKTFYKQVSLKKFNHFYNWGTVLIALPYIGVGTEYFFNSHLSLSFSINTGPWIIPIPSANLKLIF